ncbi:hypothetical protein MPC1_16380002 [Methylocella tundrae]|nr:hypothetical protein MPC1_16380002 [Methylocella tundrae]
MMKNISYEAMIAAMCASVPKSYPMFGGDSAFGWTRLATCV